MENFNPIKRIYYRYLGIMYWLIHWTDKTRILGLKIGSLVRLLSFALPVLVWLQGWGRVAVAAALLFFVWIQFSYWRGRRNGYYRFVGDQDGLLAAAAVRPLPANEHVSACATGVFSLKDWERNVVLRPAEYWQVPMGDHVLMVEHEPGRFLYQFVSAELMQDLRQGCLLYGARPRRALSVTFLSSWGPEFSEDGLGVRSSKPVEKLRQIYLTFDNQEVEKVVWQNFLYDARRVRLEQGS